MRVGVFGGVFDPVHRGHLDPVRECRSALSLERVLFVPTATPPHKLRSGITPENHRVAMLQLALAADPEMEIWPGELTTAGAAPGTPTYTVRTLERLRRELPEDELFFLLGADAFENLRSWREWRAIPDLATLAVMDRPQGPNEKVNEQWTPREVSADLQELFDGGRAIRVDVSPVPLSSSSIRDSLAAGMVPSSDDVPASVLEYIRQHGLYR